MSSDEECAIHGRRDTTGRCSCSDIVRNLRSALVAAAATAEAALARLQLAEAVAIEADQMSVISRSLYKALEAWRKARPS